MSLHNYKKASDYKVQEWIEKSIREMTPYQKQKLRDDEIVRFSEFEFMEKRKTVKSFWTRLTVLLMPFVWIVLFIGLPLNFLIKGSWGYNHKHIKWFDKWRSNVGL